MEDNTPRPLRAVVSHLKPSETCLARRWSMPESALSCTVRMHDVS